MNYFMEDEEDRARRRAHRQECLIVTKLCKDIEFQSVKHSERQHGTTINALSFGSRNDRDVVPVKRSLWEPHVSIEDWSTKEATKASVTFSHLPRFVEKKKPHVPDPYNLPEIPKKVWKFSSDLPRQEMVVVKDVPGPGSYTRLQTRIIPKPVQAVCIEHEEIICAKCEGLIDGYYFWSPYSKGLSYCRSCFNDELRKMEKNQRVANRTKTFIFLRTFKKIVTRNEPMTIQEFKRKMTLENYLRGVLHPDINEFEIFTDCIL